MWWASTASENTIVWYCSLNGKRHTDNSLLLRNLQSQESPLQLYFLYSAMQRDRLGVILTQAVPSPHFTTLNVSPHCPYPLPIVPVKTRFCQLASGSALVQHSQVPDYHFIHAFQIKASIIGSNCQIWNNCYRFWLTVWPVFSRISVTARSSSQWRKRFTLCWGKGGNKGGMMQELFIKISI